MAIGSQGVRPDRRVQFLTGGVKSNKKKHGRRLLVADRTPKWSAEERPA